MICHHCNGRGKFEICCGCRYLVQECECDGSEEWHSEIQICSECDDSGQLELEEDR